MAFDHITHHYEKDNQTGRFRIASVTPIIRLNTQGETIYLQGGKVLDAGGAILLSPPGWFYDEVKKLTPHALRETGFKDYPQPVVTLVDEAPSQTLTAGVALDPGAVDKTADVKPAVPPAPTAKAEPAKAEPAKAEVKKG